MRPQPCHQSLPYSHSHHRQPKVVVLSFCVACLALSEFSGLSLMSNVSDKVSPTTLKGSYTWYTSNARNNKHTTASSTAKPQTEGFAALSSATLSSTQSICRNSNSSSGNHDSNATDRRDEKK